MALLFVRVFAAWVSVCLVHAGPRVDYAKIEDPAELDLVHRDVREVLDHPITTADRYSNAFKVLHGRNFATGFNTELKVLDLLGYIHALEWARRNHLPEPPHPAREMHADFFTRVAGAVTTGDARISDALHRFGKHFMPRTESSDSDKTRELMATLLRGGRRIWVEQVIDHVFVRRSPSYDFLVPLMGAVQPQDYQAVALAISEHLREFRHAQVVMNRLYGLRVKNHPGLPSTTGNVLCDKMLEVAAIQTRSQLM